MVDEVEEEGGEKGSELNKCFFIKWNDYRSLGNKIKQEKKEEEKLDDDQDEDDDGKKKELRPLNRLVSSH